MASDKEKLILGVADLISETAKDILTKQGSGQAGAEECVMNLLNVNNLELTAIITFIADVLPEKLYLQRFQEVNDYAQATIAKELILFLAQEDKNSEYFKNNLENFRDEMLGTILSDVYLDENDKLVLARGE